MRKVVLQRAWSDSRATLGMLTVLDVKHDPIFTLENPARETEKDSRIKSGEYICSAYSGTKFKDVYILKDVPGRSAILIHPGNFEKDTEGCILLGLSAGMMMARGPAVTESRSAMEIFKKLIGKEDFKLTVVECANA